MACLGVVQARQAQDGNMLSNELLASEQKLNDFQLNQLKDKQSEVENRLNDLKTQTLEAKSILSESIESISASDTLLAMVEDYNLDIEKMNIAEFTSDDLGEIECLILPITIEVSGDVPDIISFITALNGEPGNSMVRAAEIDASMDVEAEKPVSVIKLVIYMYQGD